ncbi:MAG: CbiX/SirB N-terminal domain-containing protein [Burkholderiales bacterium]|nr:CbiX/SirB N-terminal domain-containing protein [Burkholderiales bacterium]
MAGKAIILFGHGSRDPLWRQPMEAVAARLRAAQPGLPVACAYLELDTPDLPTAAEPLLASGAAHITIVPMFLGTGRHAREDLPLLVEALRQAHPAAAFVLQSPVGENPELLDLLAKIAMA